MCGFRGAIPGPLSSLTENTTPGGEKPQPAPAEDAGVGNDFLFGNPSITLFVLDNVPPITGLFACGDYKDSVLKINFALTALWCGTYRRHPNQIIRFNLSAPLIKQHVVYPDSRSIEMKCPHYEHELSATELHSSATVTKKGRLRHDSDELHVEIRPRA